VLRKILNGELLLQIIRTVEGSPIELLGDEGLIDRNKGLGQKLHGAHILLGLSGTLPPPDGARKRFREKPVDTPSCIALAVKKAAKGTWTQPFANIMYGVSSHLQTVPAEPRLKFKAGRRPEFSLKT
jgi:hypothetical protein